MKHLTMIVLSSLIVFPALAEDGYWDLASEVTKKAVTPDGIYILLNDWELQGQFDYEHEKTTSSLMAGVPVKVIDTLEVHIRNYEWVGPSSCPANDPRLKMKVINHGICYEGDSFCFMMGTSIGNFDPCDSGIPIGIPVGTKMKKTRTKVQR